MPLFKQHTTAPPNVPLADANVIDYLRKKAFLIICDLENLLSNKKVRSVDSVLARGQRGRRFESRLIARIEEDLLRWITMGSRVNIICMLYNEHNFTT